jgi:hypothetical protein
MMRVDLMTAAILFVALLCACSAEAIRGQADRPGMQNGVVTDLHKYCLAYPKDSACQGPASK